MIEFTDSKQNTAIRIDSAEGEFPKRKVRFHELMYEGKKTIKELEKKLDIVLAKPNDTKKARVTENCKLLNDLSDFIEDLRELKNRIKL